MRTTSQPAKAVLALPWVINTRVAAAYGYSQHYVGRVLNGVIEPSPRFRAFLATFLHVPEGELFRHPDREAVP